MNTVQWVTHLLDTLKFMGLCLTSVGCYCSTWSQLLITAITEVIKRFVDML